MCDSSSTDLDPLILYSFFVITIEIGVELKQRCTTCDLLFRKRS